MEYLSENDVYFEDCCTGLQKIADETAALVIADPPYYKISKEEWDNQWKNEDEYLEWWLSKKK